MQSVCNTPHELPFILTHKKNYFEKVSLKRSYTVVTWQDNCDISLHYRAPLKDTNGELKLYHRMRAIYFYFVS